MDMKAYLLIDDLGSIAKENGINIPRLRGYRLMKYEEPISQEKIEAIKHESEIDIVLDSSTQNKFLKIKKEITEEGEINHVSIQWKNIHGKRRKNLKFKIKKQKQKIQHFYDVRNKYAGREDVLYVYARLGGKNWYYNNGKELENQPWFIEKVDDYSEDTYTIIYCKIG